MSSPHNAFTITLFFFIISSLFFTHHVSSFAMHRKNAMPEDYEMVYPEENEMINLETHERQEHKLMMEKPEQEEYEMINPEHETTHSAHKLMKKKHEEWIAHHGRVYKDEAEKEMRFRIFKENVEHIEAFNRDESNGFKLAVNHFADLTDEEFRNSYLNNAGYNSSLETTESDSSMTTDYYGNYRRRSYSNFKYANVRRVPRRMDWRERGAVTHVKQQGRCGSCYIFSCIGAVEGINAITSGRLISLSEQELLDCDNQNYHCGGGFLGNSFNFIRNHGITAERYYPYRGYQGYCQNRASEAVVRIKGYQYVPRNSETSMLKAVANQPISVSLDGGDRNFRYYRGGVFRARCGTRLDHDVTVVGYGVANNGLKYWIVKNSWGNNWGENGYGYLLRDSQDPRGICGIAMRPSFPIM